MGAGSEIKRLRKEREYTICKAASLAGISKAQLSRIECGKRGLSVKTAKKLGAVFGVPWRELLED